LRTCLFCNNDANSKEHVLSKRLARRMGILTEDITTASLAESSGFQARNPYPLVAFETRRVCTVCNNGWMNELEGYMETTFASLLEAHWPPCGEVQIHNPELLLRWMAKTACIVQESGLLEKVIINTDRMPEVPTLEVTEGIHLYAGFIREQNLDVRLEKGFRTWEHGILHPNREHKNGYSFVIQMNHIVLRLLIAPTAVPIFVMPYLPDRETIPIPISAGSTIQYSQGHEYNTMSDFYSSIEIQI